MDISCGAENNIKVLFVTKNFPPAIGGMEQYCHDLYNNLKKHINIDLIASSKGKKFLPIFSIYAFFKALLNNRKYDILYFGDGAISPIGVLLKFITGKRIYITIHGLDITWNNWFYQFLIPKCIRRFDKIICVSSYTKEICIKHGVDENRIEIINNGIDFDNFSHEKMSHKQWMEKFKISKDKKIFITVGRLVKRKGVEWFIKEILSEIKDGNYQYFIIGSGVEKQRILKEINKNNLNDKVVLLGRLPKRDLNSFYSYSDFMIMPNIHIKGDMEGFGIVAIEAGAWGLPVVTSGIEGVRDAIVDDGSGLIYKNKKDLKKVLVDIINSKYTFNSKERIKLIVKDKYSWGQISKKYLKFL